MLLKDTKQGVERIGQLDTGAGTRKPNQVLKR